MSRSASRCSASTSWSALLVALSVLTAVRDVYRRTRKPNDIIWNRLSRGRWRPCVVVPLARTGITPNQVTLATLPVFLAGAALMAFAARAGARWSRGAAIIELSYVLDCADGQLARLKGTSSPVGAHLDFLMDELKAFALVAAVAVRLWLPDARSRAGCSRGWPAWSSSRRAISLTTFMRRPEYAAATGAAVSHGTGDYGEGLRRARRRRRAARRSRCSRRVGRFIVHYPSHICSWRWRTASTSSCTPTWSMNAAYAARALLGITRQAGAHAMKAIIVAAGRGRRLGTETDDIPKCMVPVGGRPILHWQLDALAAAGVDDVVIVRGYLGDRIAGRPARDRAALRRQPASGPTNNILTSLFYAEAEMRERFPVLVLGHRLRARARPPRSPPRPRRSR